jgi:hypothetical protein
LTSAHDRRRDVPMKALSARRRAPTTRTTGYAPTKLDNVRNRQRERPFTFQTSDGLLMIDPPGANQVESSSRSASRNRLTPPT